MKAMREEMLKEDKLQYLAVDIIEDRIFLGLSFNQIAKKNYFSRVWANNLFWKGMKQIDAEEKRNERGEMI